MNAKKLISAILLVAGNAGLIGGAQALAASTTEPLYLFSFEETRPATVDVTRGLMKQFLGDGSVDTLKPSADQIVRFVSPKDVNTTFEHNLLTGDIRFHRNFARYLGDFEPKLPSTDEALRAAGAFLEENKLLPANPSELKVIHIGGLRAQSVIDGEKAGPVIDKLITLNYSREIKGMPVIGPGSKIVLDIGEQGEVLSLTKHWRELSPKVQEISPEEMYPLADAQRLMKAQIGREFGKGAKFELIGSQIAYFDNNGRLLQPVYAFQTKVFLPDQLAQAFDYVSVIPVLRKSPEPLNLTKLDPRALRVIRTGDTLPIGRPGKFE